MRSGPHSLPPALNSAEDDEHDHEHEHDHDHDDEHHEQRALAGGSSSASVMAASSSMQHEEPTVKVHFGQDSFSPSARLRDAARGSSQELQLRRDSGDDGSSSARSMGPDSVSIEMMGNSKRQPRSSMIGTAGTNSGALTYDAAGHGGGEEELENVMKERSFFARLAKLLNHFAWNVAILLLIAGDVVLIIFKVALAQTSPVLNALLIILIGFFCFEVGLRILAFGRAFFKNIWFFFYSLCTVATFLFLVDAFPVVVQSRDIIAIVLQCVSAFLRFTAAGCELAPAARALVSTNKARYTQHGFNLDLTYITNGLIAMGLPSTKIEAVYRNPIDQVAKFFNTMHKDHYLVVNLCSERVYPTEKFHGRVCRFMFDDHNPPPLSTMLQFCVYVQDFLGQDKENVVAVHCKGGKGRTGTMCCAWLLYSKPEMYAEQALKLFATYRTAQNLGGKLQGVSGPSQKRYIGYFEQLRFVSKAAGATGDFLQDGFVHLRSSPPMELVTLTLNHVAPLSAAKSLTDEKARDVHNITWNNTRNWSLLITHYAPIATVGGAKDGSASSSSSASDALPEEHEDPEHWTAETINRRNQARYADTKEFYFPAREKEMSSGDDSITFDMSSFHSQAKSLILSGDLKFQIFRGNLALQHGSGGSDADGAADDLERSGSGSPKQRDEKPEVYCWFWINTTFVNANSTRLILRKEQIDEVARDSKVDPEMNLQLDYFLPPRKDSLAHAALPTFHLVPKEQPLSPKTPKTPTQDGDDEPHAEHDDEDDNESEEEIELGRED